MKNIAIIGAGLLGRLIALSLARQGYQVTLFDKDNKEGHLSAAYAAAGLLTPLGESMNCEANIVEMGFLSLKLWPKLLASLSTYTFFQQTGSIVVSHQQDNADQRRFNRYLSNHYPQYQCQNLNREQLLGLEPEIARSFHQALYLPEEGQIGNRRLLIALRDELEKSSVKWLSECYVEAFEWGNGHGKVSYRFSEKVAIKTPTKNNKQSASFDLIIDCRGNGASLKHSDEKAAPLKDLRAVRGELFQLFAPQVNISRPVRLMHPRYQLYIAPKGKGYYVVGATEIESDDNSAMTVRSAMELLSAAYSVHPGFAEANIRQHVSQCRPAFSDNQPKITVQQGLIQVNGLYRHGFLIAPVVVEQINHLINHLSKSDLVFANKSSDQAEFQHSTLLPIRFLNSKSQPKQNITTKKRATL